MARTVGIGIQDFEKIIKSNVYYADKTHFIKEWWENYDDVTLIARPRRFGKTLNMSMLDRFFSNQYKNQEELFQGLNIWKEKKYRELAGCFPVINLSFANIKENSYEEALNHMKRILSELYDLHSYVYDSGNLTKNERSIFESSDIHMSYGTAIESLHFLSKLLYKYYGKKVLLFLDEYDTPMQEAYVSGYWNKFASFIRSMFNAAFKTNPYLDKAVLTGITRVSKESIFSDLNNLEVVTTSSEKYATCFGLTEEEVFAAMKEQGLTDEDGVKTWYDGFTFGNVTDIYNPWSIVNYLDKRKLGPYWANSSSNSLVGKLIREGNPDIKITFERLLNRETITKPIDEQIAYNQLDDNEEAVWSLLLATGYLKIVSCETQAEASSDRNPMYQVKLTNEEVRTMFRQMVASWFHSVEPEYNYFEKALLEDDLEGMNENINDISEIVFSSFDTGKKPSKAEPERFYHGFVLALIIHLYKDYQVRSNRESGQGRYDVMIYRKDRTGNGIIIEFKVHKPKKEKNLEETVQEALRQIETKNYDTELKALGYTNDNIRKYGFAFDGKNVLIGRGECVKE